MTEFWRVIDEAIYHEGRDTRLLPEQLIADRHAAYTIRVRWPGEAGVDEFGREFIVLINRAERSDGHWDVDVIWKARGPIEIAELTVTGDGIVFASDPDNWMEMGYVSGGPIADGREADAQRELVMA